LACIKPFNRQKIIKMIVLSLPLLKQKAKFIELYELSRCLLD